MRSGLVTRNPRITGWIIVAVCLLVTAIRSGVGTQTLGFIIRPMQGELGWTAVAIASCITAQHVISSLFAPLTGRLLDRFGGRMVVTFGAILDGIALILVSQVTEIWQFALVMGLVGGFAEACVGNALLMPFISKWFVRKRGLAIGMVSAGASLGGVIVSPIVVLLSEIYGWRGAWLGVGLIPVFLVAPLAWLFLHSDPETLGMKPDGDQEAEAAPADEEYSFMPRDAVRTPAFWILLVAWNLADLAMKGAMLNKVPYALEMGYSEATAAILISIYGISAVVGKLSLGWLADRVGVRLVGCSLAAIQSISLFAFVGADSPVRLYLSYGLLSGLSSGGLIALMPLLLANYFGRKHQGTISGITVPLLLLSNTGGALIGAWFSDATGSYAGGFIIFSVCAALSSLALLLLKHPHPPRSASTGSAAAPTSADRSLAS